MPGKESMCMVTSLSSEELLRATSCNNGCVMSCCADAVQQVLPPLPPSFNNYTTLRHWVACKPGMLFFRVANCSWGLSSCDSFRLDMACTEWVIKAKKRLRMALNIYLLGINTILCFFSSSSQNAPVFSFAKQGPSAGRNSNAIPALRL